MQEQKTKKGFDNVETFFLWALLGLNQRHLDYESSATNQLS